jgi:hypothetical protein
MFFLCSVCVAQSKFANVSYTDLHARAEAGDAQAENELGVRFRTGDGVEKDLLTALGWYRLAAKQGLPVAYFNLGAAYYNGDGVPVDEQAACKWFFLAAEAGEPSGKEGYAREQENSETNHGTVCMVAAGDAYLKGTEIPKDEKHAIQLFNTAAAAGNASAELHLAVVYGEGLGVPKDPAAAMRWLQTAAEHHDGYAYYMIGRIYETGQGVPADLHVACENYKQGALNFSWDAIHALGELLRDGRGVKQDSAKAYLFLQNSAGKDPKNKAELEELAAKLSKKDWQKVHDPYQQRIEPKSISCH